MGSGLVEIYWDSRFAWSGMWFGCNQCGVGVLGSMRVVGWLRSTGLQAKRIEKQRSV